MFPRYRSKITTYTFVFLAFLFCFAFFIVLMIDVWDKFSHKSTTTRMRFIEFSDSLKLLPCMTVCPWSAFKNPGFFYNTTEFLDNTFTMDDVFDDFSKVLSNNKSFPEFETIPSIYLGRCYMVCNTVKVESGWPFYIVLKNLLDVTGKCKIVISYNR